MPKTKLLGAFITGLFLFISPYSFGQISSSPDFYLYEDSTKKLTAETALQLYKKGKFTKATTNEVNIGYTRSLFWLVYQNEQELPSDSFLLNIGHHHINRIHFFYANGGNVKQQWLTGDYFPFSQRPVQATGFYFPINKKGIYLARIDKANESLQLSFKLTSRIDALASESDNKSIMALFTGMILLLILFSIYLFALSKRKVYIFYIFYIAMGWLWVLTNAGYGFQYFWPEQPWFASKARPVFIVATLIFSMFFLIQFIDGIRSKKIFTIYGMNVFLFALIIIILLFNKEGYEGKWWYYIQHLPPIIAILYLLLTLDILISAAIRGSTLAIFYLAAMLTLVITIIFQVSFSVGGLNGFGYFFSNFGLSVGFVMEVIILTAGLAHSFNQYRLDKEKLLIEMNKRQQENTRILMEVQEAERSQVALQLHDVAGSLLSAAKLNLSSLLEKGVILNKQANTQAVKAEEAIGLVSDMVRNLSHALSPVMLEQVGFKTTLEKVVSIFNASGKINIKLLVIGFEEYKPALNNHYTALYSIIYELLNNIAKHSCASNALLQAAEYDDCFNLIAEDDGIGMEQGTVKNMTMGMAAIQSKINYFGGKIAIDNIQPKGLLITIEIPISDAK